MCTSQGHSLTSKLAFSLLQRSPSRCPRSGDHLGALLCKETSSKQATSPSCAHYLRSEVICVPSWPLSTTPTPFCRWAQGRQWPQRAWLQLHAPAPSHGLSWWKMSNKFNYPEHTLCNQRHCLGEAEPPSPSWAQLGATRRLHFMGTRPRNPRNHLWAVFCAPSASPALLPLAAHLGWKRSAKRKTVHVTLSPQRPSFNDTGAPNHKFMNPRSFACSDLARSLADIMETFFSVRQQNEAQSSQLWVLRAQVSN